MANNTDTSKIRWGWIILLLVVLMVVAGYVIPGRLIPGMDADPPTSSPGGIFFITWLVIAGLMLASFIIIGLSLNKGALGILIDQRNMMSLSRFQIVLWTLVILSAFVAIALVRVRDAKDHPDDYVCPPAQAQAESSQTDCADPIGVQLPPLLWALMGISVTSAVASPVLKAAKAQRTAEEDRARVRAATKQGVDPKTVASYSETLKGAKQNQPQGEALRNEGALVKKDDWTDARFADIFMGEEVASFMYVDIPKVQNFFFTIVAVVAYTVALAVAMSNAKSIVDFFAFPDLPGGLIAVISISHGGYLTDKAFTHATPDAPPPEENLKEKAPASK